MGMFGKKIDISQGSKNDVTKVSTEGISQEERAKLEKQNKKLIDIFKAFDTNGDGTLDSVELAKAMDEFNTMDKDKKDGKLSKKELKAGAEYLNNQYKSKGVNIDRKGLKAFLEAVSTLTQDDEKVPALDVLINDSVEKSKSSDYPIQSLEEPPAPTPVVETPQETVEEPPQTEQPPVLNNYTVQEGENYTDLITRALKSQGIENPTEEQIKEAKEKFNQNNPDAVHKTKNGTEYLLVGAKVKLEGNLEDKNNTADQINKYNEKHAAPPAEETPETPHTPPAPAPADEASEETSEIEIPKTKAEAAKALGYRATFATKSKGIYYDEKTKTHYKWNEETKQFGAMDKSVGMVGKNGTEFTDKGEAGGGNYLQLNKDGTEVDISGGDGSTIKRTYDDNGNCTKKVTRDLDGKLIQIDNYTLNESKHIRYHSNGKVSLVQDNSYDENGNQKSGLQRNYDENGKLTNVFKLTIGKNGAYISQIADVQGNPIGEPYYKDKNNNLISKEEYDKLQQ